MQRGGTEKAIETLKKSYASFVAKFEKGAKRFGLSKEQAFEIFDKFFNYSTKDINRYTISEEMFYKVYYPELDVKMKY